MLTVKRGRKAAKPLSLVVMSKGRAIIPSRGATTQGRQPLKQVAHGFILKTSLPGKVNRVIHQPNDVLSKGGFTAQAAPTPSKDYPHDLCCLAGCAHTVFAADLPDILFLREFVLDTEPGICLCALQLTLR